MDAENRARAGGESPFDPARIDVVATGFNIHEHRLRPAIADRICARDEGMADRNHLVPGANPDNQKREMKRRCAIRYRACMPRADKFRELPFKRCDLRPLCDPATKDDTPGGGCFRIACQGFDDRDHAASALRAARPQSTRLASPSARLVEARNPSITSALLVSASR